MIKEGYVPEKDSHPKVTYAKPIPVGCIVFLTAINQSLAAGYKIKP
jgi:hypothetical protein